jgi:hypothetical protein
MLRACHTDGGVAADTCALKNGLVQGFGEEMSAEMGDHAWLIVAWADTENRQVSDRPHPPAMPKARVQGNERLALSFAETEFK